MDKRQISDDIFTERAEAIARSVELGFGGDIHTHETADGQRVFMPGATHDLYLNREGANSMPSPTDASLRSAISGLVEGLVAAFKGKQMAPVEKRTVEPGDARIVKVDESLGLVFGYAIVCKIDGEPYYDLNIDPDGERVPEHIPEDAMLKAALGLAEVGAPGNEMHRGPDSGQYPFLFPLTTDIAKALGLEAKQTGLLVAYKPTPEVLEKYKKGEYTGFSIEGRRVAMTEQDDG